MKTERNLRRSDERHQEYSELSDETLNNRARRTPKSVEEIIVDRERSDTLHKAIAGLPEIQRRRLILYYEYSLKLREIGEMEGCGSNAVRRSIVRAKEKIVQKLKV